MAGAQILQTLIDRQAITDLIYRYCRAVDRLDIPLGHSIWHEDGVADYGAAVYRGPGKGAIDHICAQHRGTLHHSHQVSNILIHLDGDRAGSESYVTESLRVMSGKQLRHISSGSTISSSWHYPSRGKPFSSVRRSAAAFPR